MAASSFSFRSVSRFFPTFSGKVQGAIALLLVANFTSLALMAMAIFLPSVQVPLFILAGVLCILSIPLGLSFGKALKESMQVTVDEIGSLFSTMQDGMLDLSFRNTADNSDATRNIHLKHEEFLCSIRQLIEQIRKTGIDIAVDAAKVANSVHSTTSKTAEQREISGIVSAASAEASNAIAEVSTSTQYVAEKTSQNLNLAQGSYKELMAAAGKTQQINTSVESFRSTVDELATSSSNILQAVSIINDIAEMTNLLSLNATIEAARAAEHGKGFAVVAEEVRNLARRIKPATQDITANINSMISIVERTRQETAEISQYASETTATVCEASENFSSMMGDFEEANEQLMKIAAAIEELSTNNHEVADKINIVNTLSQQVAENMQVSESSVATLTGVTEEMLEMVSRFSTGEGTFDRIISWAQKTHELFQAEVQAMKKNGVNVFDNNYRKVPNTNPQKYETAFTAAFREKMLPLCDRALQELDGAIYTLVIDRNGYLPIHHGPFSKPMTGDPQRDLLYSRHQRIFLSNSAEKRRCSHTKPMLLQTYMRDTGEVLNDLSLPIFIDGKHWGAFIIGCKPEMLIQ
ncbi:methyl-accepting chemotaxis protein [Desulfopila aestuarii]|uniref:Methyl-accepting chemotaxis protein n=1 Tax=Desulfopila aestuarii DSM 18488 TaxID=1121416 RepID=A0A1M7Y6Z9_9BACT|nr:methyl-accepting chemotaxis protein [Desulfopila aestuarii]SHO48435.1 methyl-accepting chemotaxis protein [Desulfopila aestuarii DSM 18488]